MSHIISTILHLRQHNRKDKEKSTQSSSERKKNKRHRMPKSRSHSRISPHCPHIYFDNTQLSTDALCSHPHEHWIEIIPGEPIESVRDIKYPASLDRQVDAAAVEVHNCKRYREKKLRESQEYRQGLDGHIHWPQGLVSGMTSAGIHDVQEDAGIKRSNTDDSFASNLSAISRASSKTTVSAASVMCCR